MKKSSSIYSVLTLLLCLLYACSYEDKTTYAGDPLPDIVIDTTNIPANLLITREDTLIVKPKVSKAGVSKEKDNLQDVPYEGIIEKNKRSHL